MEADIFAIAENEVKKQWTTNQLMSCYLDHKSVT